MKVLLLNQGHTENYGDIAIKQTIEEMLKFKNIDVETEKFWSASFIFSNHSYPMLFTKVIYKFPFIIDYFTTKHFKNIINNSYDCVIVGGGELLGNHMGFNSSLKTIVKICKKNKIPIYVIGVSGDNEMSKIMLGRYKKALLKCDYLAVRDTLTYYLLKEKFNIKNVQLYPDVVFAYRSVIGIQSIKKTGKKLLCIPIPFSRKLKKKLNLKNKKEYFDYLYNYVVSKNNPDIVISSSTKTDDVISFEFYEYVSQLKSDFNFSYVPYTNITDYINLLNKVEFIISGRMHPLIFGILCNCNFDVIPFKNKLITFKNDYKILSCNEDCIAGIENKANELFDNIINGLKIIGINKDEK